jgi:hypothetical protein
MHLFSDLFDKNACLPIFVTFEELPWLLLIKKIFEKKIYTKNTEILS